MHTIKGTLIACAVAIVSAGAIGLAQQDADQERFTVPFSDPGRPGKLELSSVNGGMITIKGTNRRDVLIVTSRGDGGRGRGGRRDADTPTTGLRQLPQPGGFSVEESNNVMEISSGPFRGGHSFEIEVPTRTNLDLSLTNGGMMTVTDVDGEMELTNINGSITLTNVAGSVVANSTNGHVKAVLTRATPDKAMAFTSLNGNVDVTLPPAIRGTFKLRTEMGNVYTDFDLQLKPSQTASPQRGRDGTTRLEVNRDIYGAANGGGPEIELRTFNGNIYLRKGAAAK